MAVKSRTQQNRSLGKRLRKAKFQADPDERKLVASELASPCVEIHWTTRELDSLEELVSASKANRPTEALIRAMRD